MYNFFINNYHLNLNVISHTVENPTACLIHVHGFLEDFNTDKAAFYNMEERIALFAPLNIVNYAIELRNHGASTQCNLFTTKMDDYVSDLHALVLYVQRKHPWLKIHVFASSMGCAVSLKYAQVYGQISGLILSAPLIGLAAPLNTIANVSLVVKAFFPLGKQYCFEVELKNALKSINANAAKITIPVCAFHAKDDELTNAAATEAFMGLISSPDKKLITFNSGQHSLLKPNTHDQDSTNLDTIKQEMYAWLTAHI